MRRAVRPKRPPPAWRERRREAATRPAGVLLLTALVVGLLGQGAYYTRVQWRVGVLVAAATVLHV